ncbi:hypothetical protein [Saccharopolyspora sp. NPDC050642]|uniref:hypothetical protein n=1 Tax=Saccharopolyspora sp. NPDC050642 TaxID=3157099 RepID=UPI0034075397
MRGRALVADGRARRPLRVPSLDMIQSAMHAPMRWSAGFAKTFAIRHSLGTTANPSLDTAI